MEFLADVNWCPLIISLLALGCVAGFLAGLLGIGGGLILVPGLYYIFTNLGFPPGNLMHICIGTSLAIIVPTGFSSARAHHKRGAVDTSLLKTMGAGIICGVFIGTLIAGAVSSTFLRYFFTLAFTVLTATMLLNTRDKSLFPAMPKGPLTIGISALIGAIATLIGIGGAVMSVPFMSLCNTPIRKAIGTASALGLFIAIPATLGFIIIGWNAENLPPLSLGYINMAAFLIVIPASVLVAKLGARAAHMIPVQTMRKGFAVFMLIMAAKLWSDLLL